LADGGRSESTGAVRANLPPHQRPPQFDYIYRANERAKARAAQEAAALGDKIEVLEERRDQLEAEQANLWCEIAFRTVSRLDLDKEPLYRLEPKVTGNGGHEKGTVEAFRAAAVFMRAALAIVDESQSDNGIAFDKGERNLYMAVTDFGRIVRDPVGPDGLAGLARGQVLRMSDARSPIGPGAQPVEDRAGGGASARAMRELIVGHRHESVTGVTDNGLKASCTPARK
jgi:hypothetical protein